MSDAKRESRLMSKSPTWEMLMIICGDPLILSASDERAAREFYKRIWDALPKMKKERTK